MASSPTTGPGRGAPAASAREGGSQIRRKTGPSVMPAASCQRLRAQTGQRAVVPYGMATVTARPVRSPLEWGRVRRKPRSRAEVLDADGGQFRPPEGAGKADQQQGTIAQAHQIVAHRGQDLPENVVGRGEFLGGSLAFGGGLAMDAGHGLSDAGPRPWGPAAPAKKCR